MKHLIAQQVGTVLQTACPIAPPGAQVYADQITGYVLWGVGILFLVAVVVAVGAIVAGRLFNMTHASRVGVISIVVVFIAAIAYLVIEGLQPVGPAVVPVLVLAALVRWLSPPNDAEPAIDRADRSA